MNEALGWGEGQGEGKRKKERGVRKGIERMTHRKKRRPLQELQKTATTPSYLSPYQTLSTVSLIISGLYQSIRCGPVSTISKSPLRAFQ